MSNMRVVIKRFFWDYRLGLIGLASSACDKNITNIAEGTFPLPKIILLKLVKNVLQGIVRGRVCAI